MKLCKDCKWCECDWENWWAPNKKWLNATCSRPREDICPVDGEAYSEVVLCIMERKFGYGHDAKYFEPKDSSGCHKR